MNMAGGALDMAGLFPEALGGTGVSIFSDDYVDRWFQKNVPDEGYAAGWELIPYMGQRLLSAGDISSIYAGARGYIDYRQTKAREKSRSQQLSQTVQTAVAEASQNIAQGKAPASQNIAQGKAPASQSTAQSKPSIESMPYAYHTDNPLMPGDPSRVRSWMKDLESRGVSHDQMIALAQNFANQKQESITNRWTELEKVYQQQLEQARANPDAAARERAIAFITRNRDQMRKKLQEERAWWNQLPDLVKSGP
jgi:hypothetical protein